MKKILLALLVVGGTEVQAFDSIPVLAGIDTVRTKIGTDESILDIKPLQTSLELTLVKNGIDIGPESCSNLKCFQIPNLYVTINVVKIPTMDAYAYSLDLFLYEEVKLDRLNKEISKLNFLVDPTQYATTWRESYTGVCGSAKCQTALEDMMESIAKEFALDAYKDNKKIEELTTTN